MRLGAGQIARFVLLTAHFSSVWLLKKKEYEEIYICIALKCSKYCRGKMF